jgi:hypothetical protein
MDPDSKRLYDLEKTILEQRTYGLSNDRHVFKSVWIRRLIQTSDGFDRFLLDYGFNFLFPCGIVFWIIFILKEINK